jgi:hypothetical protein
MSPIHFKVAKNASLLSNPIILNTYYLYFLHAISSLEMQELNRREMLICIFPKLSLHFIVSLEKLARSLIYE